MVVFVEFFGFSFISFFFGVVDGSHGLYALINKWKHTLGIENKMRKKNPINVAMSLNIIQVVEEIFARIFPLTN